MAMKFCPNCGVPLQTANPKFCPECGANLQTPQAPEDRTMKSVAPSQPTPVMPPEPDEVESVKLNVYDLGIRLEEMTAAIFQRMGYSVEMRKRVQTKSGATAEIDLLLQRGARTKAVECKNYDDSKSVGISDLRVFHHKLGDTGIFAGVFVTNTSFSEDAEKLADSTGIELWDGEVLREKRFAYELGRIRNPSLVQDPILPVVTDFITATKVSLRNAHLVRPFSSVLLYHPYLQVKYRLHATRSDPTGRLHKSDDEGTYFVDALDGDIINREKSVFDGIGDLFKKKEVRFQSREEKMLSEDLNNIAPVTRPVLSTNDYQVRVAEPEIKEKDAVKIVSWHVVERHTKDVSYTIKVRGEMKQRSFKFVPKLNEVTIRGTKTVYVPKWHLEFEAAQSSYSRRILASSGRVLVDELAKCDKCSILKKPSEVVCEECGRTLCAKHSYQERRWLCEDHISDTLRQQVKRTGLLSRFKIGRI
ncbi:MAG: restriction endonuclease [Thermoplasmatota archaeon]